MKGRIEQEEGYRTVGAESFPVFHFLPMCLNEGYFLGSPKHFTFLPQKLMESGYLLLHPPGRHGQSCFFQVVSAPGVPTLIWQHLDEWPRECFHVQRIAGLRALKSACLLNSECVVVMEVQRYALGNLWPGILQRWPLEEARASFSYSCQILWMFFCFLNTIAVMECKKGMGSGWPGWQE